MHSEKLPLHSCYLDSESAFDGNSETRNPRSGSLEVVEPYLGALKKVRHSGAPSRCTCGHLCCWQEFSIEARFVLGCPVSQRFVGRGF